jgi:hypothetical protein
LLATTFGGAPRTADIACRRLAELSRTVTRDHRLDACGDSGRGLRDRLPGCEFEYFGMGPAVVLGQDLSESSRPVGDGAVADLAAGDRQPGNGHREAAGR